MNSPHRFHVQELNVFGAAGGSGSSDEDTPRKSKKKSRSPLEKAVTSSEEERLVKSSDDEASENYGTFSEESSTPKKKQGARSTQSSKCSVRPKKQPTEMEGSAVHGLDVFSNEEKSPQLRELTPPALVRTRKFPPGSPPDAGAAKSSEVSKDNRSTGAIPKRVESGDKTSRLKSKTTPPAPPKKPKEKPTSVTPVKEDKSKISKYKPKPTRKSPRNAIQKCISLLTSPPKKDQKDLPSLIALVQKEEETMRPRTRSQAQKAKAEDKQALIEKKAKPEQETKSKNKVRERSASSSARPVDKMSLISSMDKSSESDTSPQCSPRKSRKRRDPLLPGLFGKQLEDVCSIVSIPDSDPGLIMELDPSSDVDNSSTGDKLLLPLTQLSTEADKSDSDPSDEE